MFAFYRRHTIYMGSNPPWRGTAIKWASPLSDEWFNFVGWAPATTDVSAWTHFATAPNHPARVVTFNRFLQPQMLGGPFLRGARRMKWNDVVLQLATTIANNHYFHRAAVEKYIWQKLFEVAQNRKEWSALLQTVRVSWRRPRDAAGAPWQWKKRSCIFVRTERTSPGRWRHKASRQPLVSLKNKEFWLPVCPNDGWHAWTSSRSQVAERQLCCCMSLPALSRNIPY